MIEKFGCTVSKKITKNIDIGIEEKGVRVKTGEDFKFVWGARTNPGDASNKHGILFDKEGFLIPWKTVEFRLTVVNEKLAELESTKEMLEKVLKEKIEGSQQ